MKRIKTEFIFVKQQKKHTNTQNIFFYPTYFHIKWIATKSCKMFSRFFVVFFKHGKAAEILSVDILGVSKARWTSAGWAQLYSQGSGQQTNSCFYRSKQYPKLSNCILFFRKDAFITFIIINYYIIVILITYGN